MRIRELVKMLERIEKEQGNLICSVDDREWGVYDQIGFVDFIELDQHNPMELRSGKRIIKGKTVLIY